MMLNNLTGSLHAASREELDAVIAHMGSLSQEDEQGEHCCASRAPARTCQASLQKCARSDATAAGTAGASAFHSLPALEEDDDDNDGPLRHLLCTLPLRSNHLSTLPGSVQMTHFDNHAQRHVPE